MRLIIINIYICLYLTTLHVGKQAHDDCPKHVANRRCHVAMGTEHSIVTVGVELGRQRHGCYKERMWNMHNYNVF